MLALLLTIFPDVDFFVSVIVRKRKKRNRKKKKRKERIKEEEEKIIGRKTRKCR